MAVFRIEKTRDYTVMSNYHLRDMSLSLKAKGLLSLMLSLPENWDYTMKGLARICKDGIDSIGGGIRELEERGYLTRTRVRSANGQLGGVEYTILEQPKEPLPGQEKPIRENPVQANPTQAAPVQEEPAQLNKDISSNQRSNKDLSITQGSNPVLSSPPPPRERTGRDGMRERESYRASSSPPADGKAIRKIPLTGTNSIMPRNGGMAGKLFRTNIWSLPEVQNGLICVLMSDRDLTLSQPFTWELLSLRWSEKALRPTSAI